jgi:hypothetical protein
MNARCSPERIALKQVDRFRVCDPLVSFLAGWWWSCNF